MPAAPADDMVVESSDSPPRAQHTVVPQKRPTPDYRAFERPTQLQRRAPATVASPSSSSRCPPTPRRSVGRRPNRTRGSAKAEAEKAALQETKMLFTSPFRAASVAGSSVGGSGASSTASTALLTGLPTFEFLDKLGEGSFGSVFRARCREDGRCVGAAAGRRERNHHSTPLRSRDDAHVLRPRRASRRYYAVKRSNRPFLTVKERSRALSEAEAWAQMGDCLFVVPLHRAWYAPCSPTHMHTPHPTPLRASSARLSPSTALGAALGPRRAPLRRVLRVFAPGRRGAALVRTWRCDGPRAPASLPQCTNERVGEWCAAPGGVMALPALRHSSGAREHTPLAERRAGDRRWETGAGKDRGILV